MLELIAATVLLSAETVECEVRANERRGSVGIVAIDCPDDVPDAQGLQGLADQIVAQGPRRMGFNTDFPPRVMGDVEFEHIDGAWTLPRPVQVITGMPRYPLNEITYGREAKCALKFEVSARGRAREIEATCDAFSPQGAPVDGSGFDRSARGSINRSRWLMPLDASGICLESEVLFELSGAEGDRGWTETPVSDAPRCPSSE